MILVVADVVAIRAGFLSDELKKKQTKIVKSGTFYRIYFDLLSISRKG